MAACRLLKLVHEPEAAAVAVLKEAQDPIPLTEGDTFVVVDAGGGTVDITCHKVTASFTICNLCTTLVFCRYQISFYGFHTCSARQNVSSFHAYTPQVCIQVWIT